jgi:hypothetical protein
MAALLLGHHDGHHHGHHDAAGRHVSMLQTALESIELRSETLATHLSAAEAEVAVSRARCVLRDAQRCGTMLLYLAALEPLSTPVACCLPRTRLAETQDCLASVSAQLESSATEQQAQRREVRDVGWANLCSRACMATRGRALVSEPLMRAVLLIVVSSLALAAAGEPPHGAAGGCAAAGGADQ